MNSNNIKKYGIISFLIQKIQSTTNIFFSLHFYYSAAAIVKIDSTSYSVYTLYSAPWLVYIFSFIIS